MWLNLRCFIVERPGEREIRVDPPCTFRRFVQTNVVGEKTIIIPVSDNARAMPGLTLVLKNKTIYFMC